MGKSDKKVKSDRINSLRKKYDAFLEEDKKRKERNEYILEKLDKMRYCTALVPVRQKPNVFTETRTATFHNVPKQSVDSPTSLPYNDQRFLDLDMPRKHVDETLLQEIGKKYILIPKLRQTCDDYITDTKPKVKLDDNTDWKSKYQILEQLKRDEKEQDSPSRQEIYEESQDNAHIDYREPITKDDNHSLLEYRNELPDHLKSLSKNQISYNTNDTEENDQRRYNDNINKQSDPATDEPVSYKKYVENTNPADNVNGSFEIFESTITDQTQSNDQIDSYNETNTYQYVENVNESVLGPELDTKNNIISENNSTTVYPQVVAPQNNIEDGYVPLSDLNEQPKENDNNVEVNINEETYLDKEEVTPVQDMNAGDFINAINSEIAPDSDSNLLPDTEYPVETINIQDFTPREDVQLQDGVNINPEPQILAGQEDLTNHYDPIVETDNATEPKTFEADQSQEYYNEQVDQNYDYTEEAVVDNYNTEYTAPNENYEQNEYAYYEGAQTEQAYPEANENEETLQRYDQNYEQQYGETYNENQQPYDSQQAYEQGYAQGFEQPEYTEQMQHYEGSEQAQQGLETVHYEGNQDNLTPQYVEQQLDNEQGYAEKQDENIEISNVEKLQNLNVGDQQAQ